MGKNENFDDVKIYENSNACKLAQYIKAKYKECKKDEQEITPIKLQKSLYFLFAYWGQYILKNKENSSSVEVDYSQYNENLFDDEIEAWTYGPVVPIVFHAEKEGKLSENIHYLDNDIVKKDFIDYLLPQLFDISDFGLVDLSHQDECWKANYIQTDIKHDRVIPKEIIISEYCNKVA